MTKRPPGRYGILSNLMDFCRMFRWGVLEREHFRALFAGALTGSEATLAYTEFQRATTNIRIDFQNRGLQRGTLSEAFPESVRPAIERSLNHYYEIVKLVNSQSVPPPDGIEKYHKAMMKINKEIFIAAFDAYRPCIEKLSDGT